MLKNCTSEQKEMPRSAQKVEHDSSGIPDFSTKRCDFTQKKEKNCITV